MSTPPRLNAAPFAPTNLVDVQQPLPEVGVLVQEGTVSDDPTRIFFPGLHHGALSIEIDGASLIGTIVVEPKEVVLEITVRLAASSTM